MGMLVLLLMMMSTPRLLCAIMYLLNKHTIAHSSAFVNPLLKKPEVSSRIGEDGRDSWNKSGRFHNG